MIARNYRQGRQQFRARTGRVIGIEGAGIRGKFAWLTLDSGDRVYVPVALVDAMGAAYDASEQFVFLKQALLGKAVWAGSTRDFALAVAAGEFVST